MNRADFSIVECLAGSWIGLASKVDSGRADQLIDYSPLDTIDDKSTLSSHGREVEKVDIFFCLLTGTFIDEAGFDFDGNVIVETFFAGMERIKRGRIERNFAKMKLP